MVFIEKFERWVHEMWYDEFFLVPVCICETPGFFVSMHVVCEYDGSWEFQCTDRCDGSFVLEPVAGALVGIVVSISLLLADL